MRTRLLILIQYINVTDRLTPQQGIGRAMHSVMQQTMTGCISKLLILLINETCGTDNCKLFSN